MLSLLPWLAALSCAPDVPRASGALPEDAYVWQRRWTDAVRDAVREHGPAFSHLLVLAAEVGWEGSGAPAVRAVAHDGPPGCGLVFRVEAPPEGTDLLPVLEPLIAGALAERPQTAEIQLDIDMPTRRLREYADLVDRIDEHLPPEVPLTVTTLPTWIDAPAFRALIAAADGYVLQLHWLHPTATGPALLDPDALRHVEAAARLGRPFRAALPTHGYQVVLGADGAIVGIAAEQGRAVAPEGGQVAEVRADPAAVAALLRGWTESHPAALTGVVWFRLPTAQDEHAWAWPTLAAVREGRIPAGAPRAELRLEQGAWTLVLHNDGDGDLPLPAILIEDKVTLADGLGPFGWSHGDRRFVPRPAPPLRPGEAKVIGWLRTDAPSDPASPPTARILP